jgi:chemotaxis protein methyltransferase CheR
MSLEECLRPQTVGLRPHQAELICRIARQRGGIAISPMKISFLEQRLARLMRTSGHADVDRYLARLSGSGAEDEAQALVEVLTTHTTCFFREGAQFDWLRDEALPALMETGAGRDRPITIWSAACSTGAEMWTAAMLLDQMARRSLRPLRWQVCGSDVSRKILQRASRAIFAEDEIAGLPEDYRRAYLLRSRQRRGSGHLYRISPDLRRRARLHWANLVEGPPPLDDAVDVAFLRNVLIYFDGTGRDAALDSVLSQIRPGGFLLTGHAESLNPLPSGLSQVAASIYRKEERP